MVVSRSRAANSIRASDAPRSCRGAGHELHGEKFGLIGNDQRCLAKRLLRQRGLQLVRHFLPFGQSCMRERLCHAVKLHSTR